MCKGCYSDPTWDEIYYRRQGAVDVDDFYKEVNYQTRMKGRGWSRGGSHKQKFRNRPGCPGNDFKAHVYVWTTEKEESTFFSDYYGFHKRQSRICVGCGKRNGSQLSDEYMKRKLREWDKLDSLKKGEPVPYYRRSNAKYPRYSFKWWNWESMDEDFRRAKKEYIDRYGMPSYLYNSY